MAEFQENLGTPGDYQRPVKTQQEGVNIFGAAAGLFNSFNQANRAAAANTPSPAEQRAEKTAQGLDIFAAGASSIMTGTEGGPGGNVLSFFGADAKPLFEEMKRVNEAASDGEITSAVREIQLERLVSGVMGKYPEASYEIMGQALGQLGIDHAFARAYKLQLKAQQQAETDMLKAETTAHDAAAAAGFNGSRTYMVEKGKGILHSKYLQDEQKRAMDLSVAMADANSKLTEAERTRLKADHAASVNGIANGVLYQNSAGFGPVLDTLHNFSQTIEDPEMAAQFTDTLKRSKAELTAGRSRAQALLASVNASAEETKRVNEWFDMTEKAVNELEAGDTSFKKTTASMYKLLSDTAAIEESEIIPVYQRLVGALGQGMVQSILTGSIPGISPNELKYIKDELIAGFAQGRVTSEEARKTVAAFQAAKDGTSIPRMTDENERKRTMNAAFTQLNGTIALATKDLSGTPAQVDLDTFQGANVTFLSAVIEDAPTIGLDNLEKIAPVMASAKWRHVAGKALEGQDPDAAAKMVQYNTVAVAKSLNTLKRQYLDSGQVKYDQTKQTYVPNTARPGMTNVAGGTTGGAEFVNIPATATSQESIRAAATMNALLSHLEQVDTGLIEVVPDDKLVSKDSEGTTTKMSVKDVFATDDGFLNSLANFEQFQNNEGMPPALKDQFFKDTEKFLATNIGGAAFDYSQITESSEYIQSRINAVEVRMGGVNNIQLPVTDLKSYKMRMAGTEGGPNIKPGQAHDLTRSSAAGTYGFTRGTWLEFVNKAIPSASNMSEKEKLELLKDPVMEDQIMEAFTKENFVMLKNELGKDPSWDELNIAHMLRYETPKFLKALATNPMAPARSVLNSATVQANPELTSGTLLDFWNKRLKRQDSGWDSYMQQRQGVSGVPVPANNYVADFTDDDLDNALEGR